MTAEVEFVGGDAAMADMNRWATELGPAVAKAAEPFARRVADLVANRVPVLTGQLAGSVEATADDEGAEITLGAGVAYAGWIEFGGSHGRSYVPDGRYLYPTALEATDEFEQVANDAADETIARFSWSTPSA